MTTYASLPLFTNIIENLKRLKTSVLKNLLKVTKTSYNYPSPETQLKIDILKAILKYRTDMELDTE